FGARERRPAVSVPVGEPVLARSGEPLAAAFLLSVDDAGAFLVCLREEIVLGHVQGDADLPFLADVAPRHAVLRRATTFASGPVWSIEPVGRERVCVGGEPVSGRRALASGDEIELAPNLALRFVLPVPASESALLELHAGAECLGATHVILFAEGSGGRLAIG